MFIYFASYYFLTVLSFGSLYLFYKQVFFKLAYFEWNRFYLLIGLFAGAILPFVWPEVIKYRILLPDNNPIYYVSGIADNYLLAKEGDGFYQPSLKFIHLLYSIYLAGVIVRVVRLGMQLRQISAVFITLQKHELNDIQFFSSTKTSMHFSFFRKIVVAPVFFEHTQTNQFKILQHEQVHTHQLHSIDILVAELFRIVFWIVPFTHWWSAAIRENHEYIADNVAGQNGADTDYSYLLLHSVGRANTDNNLKTNFSKGVLKNRLQILANPEQESIRKKRFRVAVPILVVLLIALAFVSGIARGVISNESNSDRYFPVNKPFVVLQHYFDDKPVGISGNVIIAISHEQMAIACPDFSEVRSVTNGKVLNVYTYDNWGVIEYAIVVEHEYFKTKYSGLYAATVNKNQEIEPNQLIGLTGDLRLYPFFSFQVIQNDEPIDPLTIYSLKK